MSAAPELSPAVPRPEHVPESLVYDFDLFRDPGLLADPHARVIQMLAEAPGVFWTPRYGGHWMFISHAANFTAARHTEGFSSSFRTPEMVASFMQRLPPDIGHIPNAVPINLDPPEHGVYRMPVQRVFSPKTIDGLKASIRALAGELIDAVAAQGQCEFMSAIAEPLPVKVFLKMLGLPLERLAEYRVLVAEHLADNGTDLLRSIVKLQNIAAIMRPTILERRDEPRDDILSMLWKLEIDGKPVTLEDIENYGVLLFIAGLDTVMNGLGHGIRHLAADAGLQVRLRSDPGLVAEATEELLRRFTFTVPVRRVTRDMDFQGAPLRENDRVMLFLPGADLDPQVFERAERFDLDRENKVHIAFNAGPHRCLGSHLARVELNILYEEMLKRLPAFRVDPERPPTFHGGHVIGVDTLHLVWDT